MTHRTYNRWFSIETLSKEFKPLFLFDLLMFSFLLNLVYTLARAVLYHRRALELSYYKIIIAVELFGLSW